MIDPMIAQTRPAPDTRSRPEPQLAPVLLLACYELGHQPLSLAWPLTTLAAAGLQATAVDLSIQPFPEERVRNARFVGIAVPMHTAMRLGMETARRVRGSNPSVHLCFFGLYAWLNRDYLLETVADSIIAGEVEGVLTELVQAVLAGGFPHDVAGVSTRQREAEPIMARLRLARPDRRSLLGLGNYARLMHQGEARLAGYVEASRGCLHTCRHCPITPVYQGRFFVVPQESVLADIRQQVEAGATHITFGDPDFLNGPGHSLAIVRALHQEFPHITFDFTTKVEHILQHQTLFPELAELGAAFVVSAFEATQERILARLHKGHTRSQMEAALAIMNQAGIPVQPTWMPFTPWTTPDDYLQMLAWMREQKLVMNVPAVQLSIRMLVPPGSALLDHEDTGQWLGELDPANFTYRWSHPDPRMDGLQKAVAQVAEKSTEEDPYTTFARIEELAAQVAGQAAPVWLPPAFPPPPPPRLTEDWFC